MTEERRKWMNQQDTTRTGMTTNMRTTKTGKHWDEVRYDATPTPAFASERPGFESFNVRADTSESALG